MASESSSEQAPLLEQQSSQPVPPAPIRSPRTVTFNPHVSTSSSQNTVNQNKPNISSPLVPQSEGSSAQRAGGVFALNNKLRRRHSQGAPLIPSGPPLPKSGAQRTTKTAQKLKLLPNPDHGEEGPDEESGRDVYSQFTRIKDPTARRDAARLGRDDRAKLPRVTAYCTANAYRLDDLMKFLRGRGKTRGAAPKLFDECIYTPYTYGKVDLEPRLSMMSNERRYSDSALDVDTHAESRREDLIDLTTQAGDTTLDNGQDPRLNNSTSNPDQDQDASMNTPDLDTHVHIPEVFLFNYGTVVIWGMTEKQEERFLKDIAKFETEKLSKDDIQTENFNFYYTRDYQARIYNDFISLREKKSYMTKLAISHALSQSVKTSLYEDLVDNTIETTKEIPSQIATSGKVNLSRKEINMQIGELFILRINIHLQGSVLDAPELMWAEPQLDPIYQAVRSYLEMDQRVGLLTERLDVIADLLAVLKDQLTHSHGESLEWIVIVLIAMEILVAAVNIVVDVWAGGD